MRISDWSSDVCSSDLRGVDIVAAQGEGRIADFPIVGGDQVIAGNIVADLNPALGMRAIVFIRELGAHRLPAIDTVPGFSGHVHGWQHGSARVVDDGLGMVAVLAGGAAVFPVPDRQLYKGGGWGKGRGGRGCGCT